MSREVTIGQISFFQPLLKLLHSPVTNMKGECEGIIQFIVISINGAEQSFSSHINKLGLSYIFLCKSKQNLIASFCHYCNIKTAVTQYKNISKYCTQKILLSLVTPHIWKSLPCAEGLCLDRYSALLICYRFAYTDTCMHLLV